MNALTSGDFAKVDELLLLIPEDADFTFDWDNPQQGMAGGQTTFSAREYMMTLIMYESIDVTMLGGEDTGQYDYLEQDKPLKEALSGYQAHLANGKFENRDILLDLFNQAGENLQMFSDTRIDYLSMLKRGDMSKFSPPPTPS